MSTTLLQRFIEGAFHVGLQGGKNFGSGVVRNPLKSTGYRKRGQALLDDNVTSGQTVQAWKDTVDSIHDSIDVLRRPIGGNSGVFDVGRKALAAGAIPLKAGLGAGHLAIGAAADVAGAGASIIGGTLGVASRAAGTVVGGTLALTGKAALKGGWALTKTVGPGVAKATGGLAYIGARDATAIAGGTAKFLWNTRNNPLVGTALVGGAVAAGAAVGNSNSQDRYMHGQVNEGYYPQGSVQGRINSNVVQGAWTLQRKDAALSPTGDKIQQHIDANGDPYKTIQDANGPMGAGFGATGDLVFALNSLRGGGIL